MKKDNFIAMVLSDATKYGILGGEMQMKCREAAEMALEANPELNLLRYPYLYRLPHLKSPKNSSFIPTV
ncbi:hypothetical protein [Haliscomenobacter sp.]|uniref:hypothetical protein n=1 Tax=Haliscomenobacter sp. TaxID=2717303 RepID=UPI003593243B